MKTKVLHVSPTYFSADSVLGGGERYAWELAKAMSSMTDVTFVSFGISEKDFLENEMKVIIKKPFFFINKNILNPLSLSMMKEIREADVVHLHQIFTVITEICLIYCWILKKPVYMTDHGGGGRTFFLRRGLTRLASGILAVSDYSSSQLAHLHQSRKSIFGGVNLETFQPIKKNIITKKLISFGRILPHKGFHHLIEAIDQEELTIVGQIKDEEYLEKLKKLALGKNVIFIHNCDDHDLKIRIENSALAIFPSTNIGMNGELLSGQPELLGIAPLESMALNVATLVSNIGAYPEICFNKQRYLFNHGNVTDLREKIKSILSDDALLKQNFRTHVLAKFTWKMAAEKCLENYKSKGQST